MHGIEDLERGRQSSEIWSALGAECPIPQGQLGLLHLGGALNERDPDDGVVGNRDARFAPTGSGPPTARTSSG